MDNGSEKHSTDAEKLDTVSLNLNSNVNAHLKNPLTGISRSQLIRNVEEFAKEKNLEDDLPVLIKGAIRKLDKSGRSSGNAHVTFSQVAQNPFEFETLEELDTKDRDTIRYEYAHKWSHPITLYVTIFLCSVSTQVAHARPT
jgi:hypothetical protein